MPLDEPVYFLLVDDLAENLLALEGLLRREGLILLKARSGPEALELLLKYDVALALLDIQMPGMDGFELAELMRGTERTRSVPIIFITAGTADQQRRFRGYEAGAVDFLQKPIEAEILKSKASVFFDLYRQKQQIAQLLEKSQSYSEALKEADRRKDEFLATLAHELRNPLAPIRNGLSILRLNPDTKTMDNVRDMMDRQLTHMVHLIDDLLDMSRVSQGKIELHKAPMTLQNAIQHAIEAVRPFIDQKQHTLTLDMPEKDIWMQGDFTRISQVISNVLNNAAKYTPEGGAIELTLREEGDSAVLSLTDDGLGIDPSMLRRIFELFAQVDSSLQRSEGGLGIGLALVQHLVGMHGGSINAQSEGIGKGSTFVIRLPRIAAPEEENSLPQNAASVATHSLRVLVVDDNRASAQTMGWMLEMMGHEPTLAYDGRETLTVARRIKPDIILLDIGLPQMNGYEVCRELHKDSAFTDTVFIAQTGWGQKRDLDMAKEAGFDYHLIKPINFDTLEELLAKLPAKHSPAA